METNGSGLFGGLGQLFGGIYDKLFKVESGDILHALEHIKETNNITDMELYSGDLEILNILTGEPNDFVISWNNINYQNETIIPSGDINFSQKIRENQTLQEVMNWVHVILGFSLITIIIQEYWFTFLKILGVGVSVYEDNQEERERLEEVYGTHVYDTRVTTLERDGTERVRKQYRTYRKRQM